MISWLRDKWLKAWKWFAFKVQHDGDILMMRYRLLRVPWWGGGAHLHHIYRGDDDLECHDHPYSFVSLVLWGGYVEELYFEPILGLGRVERHRRWLSVAYYPATMAHRIDRLLSKRCWTLVLRGPRWRQWGFYYASGQWVDWQTYHKRKGVQT